MRMLTALTTKETILVNVKLAMLATALLVLVSWNCEGTRKYCMKTSTFWRASNTVSNKPYTNLATNFSAIFNSCTKVHKVCLYQLKITIQIEKDKHSSINLKIQNSNFSIILHYKYLPNNVYKPKTSYPELLCAVESNFKFLHFFLFTRYSDETKINSFVL
jgi:hypothetical protein